MSSKGQRQVKAAKVDGWNESSAAFKKLQRACQKARKSFDALKQAAERQLHNAMSAARCRQFKSHDYWMQVYAKTMKELRARSPYMAAAEYNDSKKVKPFERIFTSRGREQV